jgi:carbon monoxide dehydrogenase subunit G
VITTLLLAGAAHAAPPLSLPGAEVIQASGPRITCQPPWCSGEIAIDAPPAAVMDTLMDFSQYPVVFPRVREVVALSESVTHITLAMPFPLQDRDYVITAVYERDSFYFEPVDYPEVDGVVRLADFSGRWMLTPAGTGTTVRYIWHTDLGADIPSWAVSRAWSTQGNEVLGRLKDAVEQQ